MKADVSLSNNCIEKIFWGEVNKKPVWLYNLCTPNGLRMNVINYGAIVQSLYVPDQNKKFTDVVLGYDTLADYISDPFFMGAVVGRCTNRIAGGKVNIQDKDFQLSTNPGGFHQHGGHVGFNRKVWDAEPFTIGDAVGITLKYTSPDGEEGYPGNLTVAVTYTLQENKWSVDFLASTDKTTIVNLTQHSYFNLGGHDSGSILNHEMKSNASLFLPANEMLMPTGEIASVENTPFDFQRHRKIGERIDLENQELMNGFGYDHFFVLQKAHCLSMKKAVVISEPDSGRSVKIVTTEPGFHFYAGNFLPPSFKGKNSATYHHRSGLCIETHHFPDAPNHPHFPSIVLRAGEKFKSRTEFIFNEQ